MIPAAKRQTLLEIVDKYERRRFTNEGMEQNAAIIERGEPGPEQLGEAI